MSREQAKTLLTSLGISEPTDEQITAYLNSVNGEVQKEKENSKKYKEDADKLKDVQKQLDDIQNANLSDLEKVNKTLEEANAKIAALETEKALATSRNNAMEKFKITSEQASKVIKDDGTLDYDALGGIIAEKEKASADAKFKEIAGNQNNPNGASNNNENKTADVLNAEKITFGGVSKDAKSARDYYA